jgi:hypothetical protein
LLLVEAQVELVETIHQLLQYLTAVVEVLEDLFLTLKEVGLVDLIH